MSSAPRLSVISPMYNSGKFLAATIESILAQTMGELELILSDDGSTDDTVAIAEEFAARDSRVKVVKNPHRGIVATRNAGLAATDRNSLFITFFDSDDLWENNAAELLIAALDDNPRAPAAHGICRCVDMNGVQFPGDDHPERVRNRHSIVGGSIRPIPRSAPTDFGALLIENYIRTPGTSMIRRSALDAVGGFDVSTEPCDDWDINLRLARLGDFAFVDEILLSWRRHSTATSNVSTRLRRAYLVTRHHSIHAQENTPEQRAAAEVALRAEIVSLRNEALRSAARGDLKSVAKRLGRVLLLGAIYFDVYRVKVD
jgi:glycosyltransferase involved in cell wall biosynthesis